MQRQITIQFSTARANSSVMVRHTQAAIFVLVLAMVIVVNVVGIGKMKLFRDFIFLKSTVILIGYQHLRQLIF
jgi:hypothetical protein